MKNLNKCTLLGNVTADGEVDDKGQYKLLKFRVATNRSWKKSDGTYEKQTTFHSVERWGAHEAVCRGIVKGALVYVEGRIDNSEYTKKDGTKGFFSKVMADDIIILSPKEESVGGRYDDNDNTPF
jgi:single-strand DNA-binding protein